jgi:O-methyltransferase
VTSPWRAQLEARGLVGRGPGTWYRRAESLRFLATRDRAVVFDFLTSHELLHVPRRQRLRLVRDFVTITNEVRAYHSQAELLRVSTAILGLAGRPGLTIVEAGCAKGASTAKLGLVARLADASLFAFDSFRGIPPNEERHTNLDGRSVRFRAGAFLGRLGSVQRTVDRWGVPERTTLVKGWFEDTLPGFEREIDVALLDVDLLSSTRTCLRAIVPRLRPGGVVFSQDGHLAAIVATLSDPAFWRDEVGVAPPEIRGLGYEKLLELRPR